MPVIEILQNDGLLCVLLPSFSLRLLFVTFYVIHIFTLYIHTRTQNTLASLVCDVPVVVDNEIPTGWETPGRLNDGPL